MVVEHKRGGFTGENAIMISQQSNGRASRRHEDTEIPVSAMSTATLESKLRKVREQSQKLSQLLTQKLASSQSGQNLLHIGTSLSTLPPDLHLLLTSLHPVLSAAEQAEKEQLQELRHVVDAAHQIRLAQRRAQHATECADLYADIVAAEQTIQREGELRQQQGFVSKDGHGEGDMESQLQGTGVNEGIPWLSDTIKSVFKLGTFFCTEQLDHVASLERAAHSALCFMEELRSATSTVSAVASGGVNSGSDKALPTLRKQLEPDTERAQFVLKLAPRIRRLEADTTRCLGYRLETVLKQLHDGARSDLMLMLGHIMRGLTLLGRGTEVESIFARVAIMPLIRSKVSMGRLDEGGSRGECAGLVALLDEMVMAIHGAYGPVLRLAETMFELGNARDVDLLTAGVWVPIATALMADAGIKMAIFSPGIASILQTNYIVLDRFLSVLARRLLAVDEREGSDQGSGSSTDLTFARIKEAQDRIYSHPKTSEFSKKWNLPIYYQLRFGDCCSRLNKAIDSTRQEGWVAEVYSGSPSDAENIKQALGFELPLFLELYDILVFLWRDDVILRPLSNRFLRGAVQLLSRLVSFVSEGMEGTVKFGAEPRERNGAVENGPDAKPHQVLPNRGLYCWGDSEQDLAAVAWELTILDSSIRHDYVNTVCKAIMEPGDLDMRTLVADVLKEAADQIPPIIDKAWNSNIVNILTEKCSKPLAAVKGVAATYRMTNRPPPTHASPFVGTILRPLKEFGSDFGNRTPERVGGRWKHQVISSISERYAVAVEELIGTVERTELALNSRRARKTAAGGMRDGDKVKLQLYLDYSLFKKTVEEVGVDPGSVMGLVKLKDLTAEGEGFLQRKENGN